MIHKIIVLCTGNICRSPLTEALLRQQLSANQIQVCSAGIAALSQQPAAPFAQEVARDNGLDISAHRAQQANQSLLTAMDLILTLDHSHNEWVGFHFPQLQGRIYKLGRWQGNIDIADPYRLPKSAFQKAFSSIQLCVEDWVKRLEK